MSLIQTYKMFAMPCEGEYSSSPVPSYLRSGRVSFDLPELLRGNCSNQRNFMSECFDAFSLKDTDSSLFISVRSDYTPEKMDTGFKGVFFVSSARQKDFFFSVSCDVSKLAVDFDRWILSARRHSDSGLRALSAQIPFLNGMSKKLKASRFLTGTAFLAFAGVRTL